MILLSGVERRHVLHRHGLFDILPQKLHVNVAAVFIRFDDRLECGLDLLLLNINPVDLLEPPMLFNISCVADALSWVPSKQAVQ
jgi:hypothetical protein